ncbi:hypothetical protein QF032_004720 [Streptomyces achromogenes]|uniref:Uncharacterized protein n=1 Tax=Streptomyces achromogenes TaxID=67255 RepID=A0ABU0Q4Z7_STRAH|nr:hypothetical protein [Streptomyces achromogenes]MDQ0685729.1 hypothetical protein [Streptomyces achromogenes]MDQ0832876.1 hypothetical protein [Streptomyces achromogenes]
MTDGSSTNENVADGSMKGRDATGADAKGTDGKGRGGRVDLRRAGVDALLFALAVLASLALTHLVMSPGTARDMCFVLLVPVIAFGVRAAKEAVPQRRTG